MLSEIKGAFGMGQKRATGENQPSYVPTYVPSSITSLDVRTYVQKCLSELRQLVRTLRCDERRERTGWRAACLLGS